MLEEIIAVVHARSSTPVLIEIARTHRGARIDRRVFAWSNGRITGTVGIDGVELKRRCGVMTSPFALDARELAALASVSADWSARRASWAAYYVSSAGYPPGFGAAAYYQPCGAESVPRVLGRDLFGRAREGDWLIGSEEIRELDVHVQVAPAIEVTGEIWRRGERHTTPGGEIVGCVYVFGSLHAHAYRRQLRLSRVHDTALVLESGEEAFVAELTSVVAG